MSRLRSLTPCLAALLCLAGCQTGADKDTRQDNYAPLVARFFLEAKPGEAGVPVTLPQSGVTVSVGAKPVIVEYDILNAEVVQVDLGRCLMVQLTAAATRDLYRLSVPSLGRRLVLSLNDRFLGVRRIDAAVTDGVLLVFLELPEEQLPELVDRLKRTSAEIAKAATKAQ